MSRDDFMRQLEMLLEDITQEEKQEALSYYQSYFEDAGAENEERILRELESPQKVAATIKADLGMGAGNGMGEYTEHGFTDNRFQDRQELNIRRSPSQGQPEAAARDAFEHGGNPEFESAYAKGESFGYEAMRGNENDPGFENPQGYGENPGFENPQGYGENPGFGNPQGYGENPGFENSQGYGENPGFGNPQGYGENPGQRNAYGNGEPSGYQNAYGNRENPDYGNPYGGSSQSTYNGNQALKIILIVAIAVLTSPVWLGTIGVIASTVFGLAIAAVCVTISLFFAGGVMFGVGIGQMAAGSLGVGFALSGAGMLVLALAVLSTLLCIWVCGKLIPWICRVVKGLWRGFFSRKQFGNMSRGK